jgi:cobalt-zinc-cadmium efflux system membrane fusion protein
MFTRIIVPALLASGLLLTAQEEKSQEPEKKPDRIILDPVAYRNLGLHEEGAITEASDEEFQVTEFALGRIEVLPSKRAVVSTRIPGRAQTVIGKEDMQCEAGDELLWVESRQPGDPPPIIRVDAPIAGTIAKVNVAQGQPVEPGMALMEIYDLSIVEAVAAVPQHLAGKIGKGMEARIKVAGWDDEWTAELAHIGADADAESGTLEAAFHVPNDDRRLRPGMRAEFHLILSKIPGVQSVPREAVLTEPAGRYVFVKDYELPRAFVKSPVATGAENDRFIEITGGLNPGDEIVSKGSCAYALSFAGKGSVSLKEALDAAHGHPHNEDGSEMTAEQRARAAASGGADHHHEEGGALLWQITSGVLLLLLVLATLQKRQAVSAVPPPATLS